MLPVLVVLVMSVTAFAQANIGFNGIGVKVGYVMPEDPIESTFGFGLNADLGTITPKIKLGAFLDYWSKSYDYNYGYGVESEATFSVLAIGALARYDFTTSGNIKPYVAGGLGLDFGTFKWEWENPLTGDKEDESESDSEFAIHLIGGAEMPLSPTMTGFAEVKYVISDPEYFGIFVGVMYKLK